MGDVMKESPLYDCFELTFEGVSGARLVEYCAEFTNETHTVQVPAFHAGAGRYLVRFMPQATGVWQYTVRLPGQGAAGEFLCTGQKVDNHGPVTVEGCRFYHADGTRFLPFGTTCYAWAHQSEALHSLGSAPFN